jgi:F-type H+-transporting ATPase subunit a
MSSAALAVTNAVTTVQERTDAVQAFIMHHVVDSDTLKLPFATIHLPPYLSLHGLAVVLAALLLVPFLLWTARRRAAVPSGARNLVEWTVVFVRDQIVVPYLGPDDGRRLTPYFCSLFFFILAMNLVGLIPGMPTATANVSVTGALALLSLGFMILGAMARQGVVGFFKGFAPHGVPLPVLMLLIPIEFLGLFIKAFALTIRLFANELAGHIVVFFLLGLVVIFGAAGLPFLVLAVLIYLLEVFVAFLQAYIFTLLSAVFIGQRLHPEH